MIRQVVRHIVDCVFVDEPTIFSRLKVSFGDLFFGESGQVGHDEIGVTLDRVRF